MRCPLPLTEPGVCMSLKSAGDMKRGRLAEGLVGEERRYSESPAGPRGSEEVLEVREDMSKRTHGIRSGSGMTCLVASRHGIGSQVKVRIVDTAQSMGYCLSSSSAIDHCRRRINTSPNQAVEEERRVKY